MGPPSNNVIPRACHNCRVRKIRCNRQVPCSNCVTSSLVCKNDRAVAARVPETAAIVAAPSNAHIDTLQERIQNLESAYETLLNQHASPGSTAVQKIHTTQQYPARTVPPRNGDSSFDRQAYAASQAPELAAASVVADEVNALRSMISNGEALDAGECQHAQAKAHLRMDLVPSDFAIRIFRALRDNQSLLFLFHPVHDLAQLESLCQQIYFPIDPLTTGHLTVFHGILHFALGELCRDTQSGLDADQVQRYRDLCWHNFQAGLETHELGAVASYENTLALAMAALDAQTKGKLTLQWNFITAAARHCLTLGYHRNDNLSRLPPSQYESCRRLFWHVYMSDSGLSLTLGRAPLIQDWDVDVPPATVSQDPKRAPWDLALAAFVHFSTLQSTIFRQLYSPMARRITNEERRRTVADLVAKMTCWHTMWKKLDYSVAYHSQIFRSTFAGVDIAYYSVLTLLHRGATSSTAVADITPECFQAAREGLEAHLTFYPQTVTWGSSAVSIYSVWILLFSSFTPFIVTFLHCIANSDVGDLDLLGRVVETIAQMVQINSGCRRQYEICTALHRIADTFVGASTKGRGAAEPLNMSLQNPAVGVSDWVSLQSMLDDWNGQQLNAQLFAPGRPA